MKHLHLYLVFGCLSLCALLSMSVGAGEYCQVGEMSIPVGKQKQDSRECILHKCVNQNNRIVLDSFSCAPQEEKRGCRSVPGPVDAPFPDCCPISLCRGKQWDD
uniref:La1-like protein n=1 Tax=Hadrurus spadix TaxID=141984 RepID=A0A1W7RA94_9SCOR